ncbi:host attachment protein [Thiococcus pfennigii]|jgi:protein required for attachment to host cells|uniref:host attachment protein n=1 Tax=Thiococcus pfennigii TaxID=1057 RepID=UPI001905DCF0|nr:host attachment protein [Thiococcus pfennigii]MBK1700532.1 Host attachment protein [Thiococcus pfennigii]
MPTWVLVADNSRARLFSAEKPASPLIEFRDLTSPEGRLHEGDLVTDKRGRDQNPASGTLHGLDPSTTRKQDAAERFAQQICEELDVARARAELSKLYVVAAPAFLGLLRRNQSNALRQTIAGEIDKNLTTQDPTTIRKHLPDYL